MRFASACHPKISTRELKLLLEKLLCTAEEVRLSAPHRAAVCDALCGFLEQGSTSTDAGLRELCLTNSTWQRIFRIYLERSEDAQAKPMKQILLKLVKLIARVDVSHDRNFLISNAVFKCLSIIFSDDKFSYIKPAINVLDVFLVKGIVNVFFLVYLITGNLTVEPNDIQCDLPLRPSNYSTTPQNIAASSSGSIGKTIQEFAENVLRWVQQCDIAPSAGRLLASSFMSLYEVDNSILQEHNLMSIWRFWAIPICEIMHRFPELAEDIELHVLPNLLRLDVRDAVCFLRTLPIGALMTGNVGALPEGQIRLCLLVLKTLEEVGDIHSDGMNYATRYRRSTAWLTSCSKELARMYKSC